MEKTSREGPGEGPRSPEAAEEELIARIRDLLKLEELDAALALFEQLHPSYQGDLLADLPRAPQQELLTGIPPEGTADILEHLAPRTPPTYPSLSTPMPLPTFWTRPVPMWPPTC